MVSRAGRTRKLSLSLRGVGWPHRVLINTSIGDENVPGLGYNILQRSMKPCSGTRPTALQCAPKTPKFIVYHMNMRRRYNCPYHQAHGHRPVIIVETEKTYDEGG